MFLILVEVLLCSSYYIKLVILVILCVVLSSACVRYWILLCLFSPLLLESICDHN